MKKSARYSIVLISLLFLPIAFSGFQDRDFELSKNLDIYYTLMRELNLFYVDETDPGELVKASVDQMLRTLDPYTSYIPESRMEDLQLMTTGEYGGIGALIRQREGYVIVTDPYEGFPAQKAGLRAGDIIRKIDGRKIADLNSSQIGELMKGQVGTKLKMTVERSEEKTPVEIDIVREKIRISNVPYYQLLNDSYGYIRLSGFTQGAAKEVLAAFNELKDNGMEKLILDLRSNPGGLLIEAVDVMNIFVPNNQEIVSTIGKVKQWNKTYYCRREPADTTMPLVVLVNSQSASAAEIVAGAVQDLDRGVVIGQRSFGKGLVQTTRDLSYNSKLKLTTAKYYIPSGRCIQALDYSHRREDGSVGHIPDSLISEFATKNGRGVYDGGGILPDVEMPVRMLSRLSTALIYKDKFFDFATDFRNSMDEIDSPENFHLDDKYYTDFVHQLVKDSFHYETASSRKLNELIDVAKREKYYDKASNEIEELKSLLETDLEKDTEIFAQEIKNILSDEILGRYYYQKGRIQFMLKEDPLVHKAREILSNENNNYTSILSKKKD
ncbi:MAG: S41 family peptidase [Bacteroidetes bacterium]|nr:S41 family peptidase [Bacteroidota bacterium]